MKLAFCVGLAVNSGDSVIMVQDIDRKRIDGLHDRQTPSLQRAAFGTLAKGDLSTWMRSITPGHCMVDRIKG
jgi:hypothetical protein